MTHDEFTFYVGLWFFGFVIVVGCACYWALTVPLF